MVVQHNMQAVNANRMLNVTTKAQSKSTEKLSSGYKINRAADDAAGLSISEKMRKQIRGLDQASTNAEDGVSAVQTAEGALTEVHSMLQRMNELAVQAANGTNSESDREAIQAEMSQLTTEIDRVAETTKFNETSLLKGANGIKKTYLEGRDAGLDYETFIDGEEVATLTMDLAVGNTIVVAGQTYNIVSGTGTTPDGTDSITELQKEVGSGNQATVVINGTTYTLVTNAQGENVYDAGTGHTYLPEELAEKVQDGSIVNWGTAPDVIARDTTDTQTNITQEQAVEKIKTALIQANNVGVTDGEYATIPDDPAEVSTDIWKFEVKKGQATTDNSLSFNLHVGADADMSNKINVNIDAMNVAGLGLTGLNVADDSGVAATYAIDAIASAIETVSAQRSALGAIQNRLEHTINNLDNVVENTTSAESRIRDTDMAEEMVEYSKNNILAQAGQSMLAQANQATQGVLSLLQ
jgi:flagellin